jgi:peptidoglycan/LPS O-acetylase OafA/YrhL
MKPMPQLDGVRAVAVLLVLVQHYADVPLVRRLGPGGVGVWLFFVLSGFLITRILLDVKGALDAGRTSFGAALRAFWARRFVRIFPLYYAVLFVTAALDVPPVRSSFAWHAAYVSNLYFARRGAWDGPVTPFWSLSIEEQFYLLWPLAVLGLARRHLVALIAALVTLCPLLRLVYLRQFGAFSVGLLPFGCADQLAWGALLACCWHDPALDGVRRAVVRAGVAVGAPFVLLYPALGPAREGTAAHGLAVMFHLTLAAVAAFAVVDGAGRGFGGTTGRVLGAAPLRYLGRISYGVYVQHTFVRTLLLGVGALPGLAPLGAWLRATSQHPLRWAPFATATVLLTATASWYLFERPINVLKDRFPYAPPRG